MNKNRWIISSVTKSDIPFKQIFDKRNIYNMKKEDFFIPKESDIYDPMLMKGMEKAVKKINTSIEKGEKICIYGDYDVDGISATSILLKTFQILNYKNTTYYIPMRKSEGYGLNNEAVEKLKNEDVKLVITVDCGITALSQVEYAKQLDISIIITDHHQIQDEIPEALSVINPHQKDCPYPFKNLCGAGIAYKLSKAMLLSNNKKLSDELTELAGIATVADVMEINGENRLIVKKAIDMIKKGQNKGIDTLLKSADINRENTDTYTIGFQIGPRINSAGRISDPKMAVELLTSDDEEKINQIAGKLNSLNAKRQEMVKKELEEAMIQAEEHKQDYITIAYSKNFEKGVVGLVASKLLDKYKKPAIVMAVGEDEIATGSCRSIEALDMEKALKHCRDLLEKFGGHKMAAGLSIKVENIEKFRKKMDEYLKSVLKEEDFIGKIYIDSFIPCEMINSDSCRRINTFEPFGLTNPNLRFVSSDVKFENPVKMGKDENHIKAKIKNTNSYMIKFNIDEKLKNLDCEKTYDIVYTINENVFNSNVTIQANLEDIRYSKEISYEFIHSSVLKMAENFQMGYEMSLFPVKGFESIKFEDIFKLKGKTLYICYSYDSFYCLKKSFEMQEENFSLYLEGGIYSLNHVISFMPCLEMMDDIDIFENIILMDDIKEIEQMIYETGSRKYIIQSTSFNVKSEKYILRDKMVPVYNYIKNIKSGQDNIKDVLEILKMNPAVFFISCLILENSKLIDIKYDFKYNKVYAKIIKTKEKRKLDEDILYNCFNSYIKLLD